MIFPKNDLYIYFDLKVVNLLDNMDFGPGLSSGLGRSSDGEPTGPFSTGRIFPPFYYF